MDIIKSVEINKNILDKLKEMGGYGDRLGTFAVIKFKEVPNQPYMNKKGVEIINSIFMLMGFGHEYGGIESDTDFQEAVDCFVSIDDNVLTMRHKYWPWSKCQMFIDLLGVFCRHHNVEMRVE